MKHNHLIYLILGAFFIFGCSPQPVGDSLLTKTKSTQSDDSASVPDDGALEIKPDNDSMSVFIDDTNRVEITGSCKDLGRKKNRIIVEVFAGEDEATLNPYVSNSFSDLCLDTTGTNSNEAGLTVGQKCFWVTNGIGITEDSGLPTERSFPQCHNGRFGFAFRIGKIILPTAGSINLKYTVRLKLRTLEGILADSDFARVLVTRELQTPVINSATYSEVAGGFQCSVKSSPARFNAGITYDLTRTYTDILSTNAGSTTRYSLTTATITDGSSVFNFNDAFNSNPALSNTTLLRGLTYNYTLTSTENNFAYVPAAPTKSSTTVSCVVAPPVLSTTPQTPAAGTCYSEIQSSLNPGIALGTVKYQWGYNTNPNWTGPDSSENVTFNSPVGADCVAGTTQYCTEAGLAAKTTFYFAVREIGIAGTPKGKWSTPYACKTP